MGRHWFFIGLLLVAQGVYASNQALVYQGRVVRPDGNVPDSGTITFTISIYSPAPSSCLLYSETHSVAMTNSKGMFSLDVGKGTRTDGGSHSFNKVFVNGGTLSGLTCGTGSSYTPNPTDDRVLHASFVDLGNTMALSPMKIKSVPFAMQAHEIDGWGIGNLVKVSTIGSATTFTTTEMANAKALTGAACALNEILKWDGSTWLCAADDTGPFPGDAGYGSSNKGVVAFDTDAATSGITVTSGVARLNTGTGANQIVKLDGTGKLPAIDGSALTGITATGYSGVLPIANGGTNSSTTLNNDRLMISAGGKIVEAPALTNGQIMVGSTGGAPTAATLGQSNGISITNGAGSITVSTNATSANTASAIVARDASGNFSAGAVTVTTNIFKGSSSGNLTVTAPATVTDYTLTWPSAVGAAGSVLTTDATGQLSWTSPSAIGDASYAAKGVVRFNTDAATSGITVASGVASVNTGTGANQIVKLDGTGKLPAIDASALTGLTATQIPSLDAGKITTGVLPIARGGTNNGSLGVTAGGMIYADGSKLMTTAAGTSGQALISAGAGVPAFGTLGVAGGGTGLTAGTSGGILYFDSASTMASSGALTANGVVLGGGAGAAPTTTAAGTANQVLRVPAGGGAPVFGAIDIASTGAVTGVLAIANGGTNSSTALTNNKVMVSSGGAIVEGLGHGSTNTASTFVTRDASGNFAAGAITNNSNILKGATAGTLTMTVPTSVTSYTLTWPSAVGAAGNILTTDASGQLSWTSPTAIGDASYSAKGVVQFNTDAATSGISIASGVATVNSGTGANQIVKLDGSSKLPAVDGSALTNLSAGNISSGVLSIARGGTNNGSLGVTAGGMIYADGSKLMTTAAGTSGQALISAGAGAPAFGTLGVGGGGTGLTTGTSGGIPYYSAANTMASSSALTANGVVLGGGAGSAPTATAAGAAYSVLRVPSGGGAPGFGAIDLSQSAAVTGTLGVANGGTGASSLAANRLVGTNGTGSALQAVTCTQGYVLSFDSSGNYGCYTVGSVFAGFVNDGNSFGAAATLGTSDAFALNIETNNQNRIIVASTGEVAIGGGAPVTNVKLDVGGIIRSFYSTTNTASVDFSKGNTQYFSGDCTAAVNLTNMVAGATYTLIVTDTTTNTCSFQDSGSSIVAGSFLPANGPRISGKRTVYQFMKVSSTGGDVMVSWIPGFN